MAWPSARYKTFANGGSCTPADLNGVQDLFLRASGILGSDLADGTVASRNIKTTSGLVVATSDLTSPTWAPDTWTDLPGATLSITPDVASSLFVVATFEFQLDSSGLSWGSVAGEFRGTLTTDGAQNARETQSRDGNGPDFLVVQLTQAYRVALTAAAHTVKLQARYHNYGSQTPVFKALSAHTNFLYWLEAS